MTSKGASSKYLSIKHRPDELVEYAAEYGGLLLRHLGVFQTKHRRQHGVERLQYFNRVLSDQYLHVQSQQHRLATQPQLHKLATFSGI